MTIAAIPADSLVARALPRVDYCDAFAAPLPSHITTASQLAHAIFDRPAPMWVRALFGLRNALVRPFGLETKAPPASYIPIGRIYAERPDEVVFGLDDKHLDFRAAILVRDGQGLIATTVKFNGWPGKLYFAFVRPFHGPLVRRLLTRATVG